VARPRDLTTAVLRFGHMLRASGMPLTIGEMMDGVRALEAVDLLDRQDVYLALRTTLVARYEEFPIFDRCFETFWRFQAGEGQELEGLTGPATPAIPRSTRGTAGPRRPRRRSRSRSRAGRSKGTTTGSRSRSPASATRKS
jgi:uncharacterized protein with von Willebrand factor type A (vWA) domain